MAESVRDFVSRLQFFVRDSVRPTILRVREIIRHVIPTLLPGLPEHVKGVINLRGKVIPVVDLRLKFGFPAAASGERACIVVLQMESSSTNARTMGAM